MTPGSDPRLRAAGWSPSDERGRVRFLVLVAVNVVVALWYFGWLLRPERIGNPALYAMLVCAELFNVVQAAGFWWTCAHARRRARGHGGWIVPDDARVDVFIPVCGEPVDVVEATVAAAVRMRGARVEVSILDDGDDPRIRELARRYGADYLRRRVRTGAKAGNINTALACTTAPFVAVFDCDHVPDETFLERTLPVLAEPRTALVQTPQYYANEGEGGVPAASWAQQALFFGPIARGKDALGATFCCGTNVVLRRAAIEGAGGFPEASVTEDFELSILLHEQGWKTAYVPEVLAQGLGPPDVASYVSQQHRWARGCLSAVGRIMRARLPLRTRAQYLLSAMFFLTGWTFLVYMSLPVIRLLTGAQPVAAATADQFLLHFLPYFGTAILTVALAGAGRYSFDAFALMVSIFWVHIHASVLVLLRRRGSFVVTAKRGTGRAQPFAVLPAIVAAAVLASTGAAGLLRGFTPAILNNVAFAVLHVFVLVAGMRPALRGAGRPPRDRPEPVASEAEREAELSSAVL